MSGMKVRVKYCGGCNPRFDREAEFERLEVAFPDAEFVVMGDDEGPFDYVIVLCGCPAACASHEDLHGAHGKTVVTSEEECRPLQDILRAISK